MKIKDFEFNLRELSGAMGDFGTLIPLAVGYIAVCGLNPAGILVAMGVANIATGLIYRLPMPIEPMKVLAVVAIAQAWSPSLVYASGLAMGIVWVFFAATGLMDLVAKYTPRPVIRGIQASLGVLLAIEAVKLLSTWWLLGAVSIVIVLVLRQNRYAPAALVLAALGAAIILWRGEPVAASGIEFAWPSFTRFSIAELWPAMLLAGFAQIPLTATNAVLSTASLIKTYWPDRAVSARKLSLNMGIMNLVFPFFGGMPLCHGAGGLAAQYYFGARTGGANIIEGLIEILLGLFLASSIAGLFLAFPPAIIGAMMFLVGVEMVKFAREIAWGLELIPLALTVLVSVLTNMAWGFLAGMACHYLLQLLSRRKINKKEHDPEK